MADPFAILQSNQVSLPQIMSAASEAKQNRLREMMLNRQMEQQNKLDETRAKASQLYASGDRKAARDTAVAGGDFDFADHMSKLDDADLAAVKRRGDLIGQVAQFADTPEKWDQGVDFLVAQGYTDLAPYKGKFSPAARMSALASAGQIKEYFDRNKPVNVGPGGHLVDPTTGKEIFSAPFAPRPVTVGEGQTVVEYQPGGGMTGSASPDDIFGRMIHQESRGQQFGANGAPLQSSAGALGIAQVMPGTAPEAAALAGLPYDENRYRTDPQYNAALGRAYFGKQLEDFKDPTQAVAAYNAGPGRVRDAVASFGENWLQHMPAETQDYVGKVLGPAGSRVIAQGAPKPAKQPDAPSGYRFKSDGTLEPIPGGPATRPTQQNKAIPSSTEQKLADQFGIYASLKNASEGFNPDYAGNTITGGLENTLQGLYSGIGTPGQRDWWANFRQTDNLIRNQMFGSALTATEKAAYEATTISERMDPKEITRNLKRRTDIIEGALRRRARTLAAQGYNPEAISALLGDEPNIVGNLPSPNGSAPATPSTPKPTVSNW